MGLAPAPPSHVVQDLTFFQPPVACNSVRAGGGGARTRGHMFLQLWDRQGAEKPPATAEAQ